MTLSRLLCTTTCLLLLAGGAMAKPGTTRSTANLRANPDTASAILGTIPGGARLEVGECREGWCAVTYQGQSGHVIQSAVSTGTRTVRRAPAKRVARTAPPPRSAPPGSIYDDEDFEPAYPVGPRVYVGPPMVYGPGPYWGHRPWGWGPGWGWRRW